jgi:DNA polymerase III sliding clamp (beta) subunit (PCNA family)
MKIRVAKPDLDEALRTAAFGIVGSGSDLSTHFLFRVYEGAVQVLTYGLTSNVGVPLKNCEHEGKDGDAFTVESWRLLRWVSAVADAALTLEHDSGTVTLTSPRSTIRVASLDPSKFPFWDQVLAETKMTGKMKGSRLASILGYAKHFVADLETTKVEISQAEMRDGYLYATDKKAVTLVKIDGMDDAKLRIAGKNLPVALNFLGVRDDEEIEILEHDNSMFFRGPDGAVLGLTRPLKPFPAMDIDVDLDEPCNWEVSAKDLNTAIRCLSASAAKDDTMVTFTFDTATKKAVAKVASASGHEDVYPIDTLSSAGEDQIPAAGFTVESSYLGRIMSHFGEKSLVFGIHERKRGGYTRLIHKDGEDVYLTVVVWRK